MGNNENKSSSPDAPGEVYCLKQREIRIMSEIWKSVETDLVYYGTQFYSLLFHDHPEYVKYFQDVRPHEFQVDVPVMRTKFSLTCSTLAGLFVEYSHKSQPREHLLGYVAMVHKDMNLTQKDMENFMTSMMEMLMKNFAELLTADCYLAYVRYATSLTSRLQILMKRQRELIRKGGGFDDTLKRDQIPGCFSSSNCIWLPCRNQDLIYGRPIEFWNKKNQHWIVQRAVWATMDAKNHSDSSRKDMIVKNSIVNISRLSSNGNSTSTDDDDQTQDDNIIRKWYNRRKKQYRKQTQANYLSTILNNDITDNDEEITPRSSDILNGNEKPVTNLTRESLESTISIKSGDSSRIAIEKNELHRTNEIDRGTRRHRVSIVNSTARERRRRNISHEINVEEEEYFHPRGPRKLTIHSGISTGINDDRYYSSPDGNGTKYSRAGLVKSKDLDNQKTKNRGTSISNVPNRTSMMRKYESKERSHVGEKPRASFMIKEDSPPSSIIASSKTAGRNTKSNKRVSISNAHWFAPRESDS